MSSMSNLGSMANMGLQPNVGMNPMHMEANVNAAVNMAPTYMMPTWTAPMAAPMPYAPMYHHGHHHHHHGCGCGCGGHHRVGYDSTGAILVLFILLVIISRAIIL